MLLHECSFTNLAYQTVSEPFILMLRSSLSRYLMNVERRIRKVAKNFRNCVLPLVGVLGERHFLARFPADGLEIETERSERENWIDLVLLDKNRRVDLDTKCRHCNLLCWTVANCQTNYSRNDHLLK